MTQAGVIIGHTVFVRGTNSWDWKELTNLIVLYIVSFFVRLVALLVVMVVVIVVVGVGVAVVV